jgi:YVTN family beta-propeller protein
LLDLDRINSYGNLRTNDYDNVVLFVFFLILSRFLSGEVAMKFRICRVVAIAKMAFVSCFLGSAPGVAQNAYITNGDSNDVSVINTATDTVIATIRVGKFPQGVAVGPDGKAYVANESSDTVSVIETATNTVIATIHVGIEPVGVAVSSDGSTVYVTDFGFRSKSVSVINTANNKVTATIPVGIGPTGVVVTPDGGKVYVANYDSGSVSVITTKLKRVIATIRLGRYPVNQVAVSPDGTKVYVTTFHSNTVSVIDTANDRVTATIPVGIGPIGVAVSPDGSKVYVTNSNSVTYSKPGTVSVINTANNEVTNTIPVGTSPSGISVSPDGSKVYVANSASNDVSVIATATDTVIATLAVGRHPVALGLFIQRAPPPRSPNGSMIHSGQAGLLTTSEGVWTFGPQASDGPDWHIQLNGNSNGSAVQMQITNGSLYAYQKGTGHWYIRQSAAWVDIGITAPDGAVIYGGQPAILTTSEGTWTFGAHQGIDWYVQLNGKSNGWAVQMQITNGNLYALQSAGLWWVRQNDAWVNIGSTAPVEGAPPAHSNRVISRQPR